MRDKKDCAAEPDVSTAH